MSIPKIIHQIWIGPKPRPSNLMDTWKNKHPDYEYILWTETEVERRGIIFECAKQIEMIQEYAGKADIMRLEILYKYGGVFIDADSICIEPLDDFFMKKTAFATYENENVRAGLVANGTMGYIPQHPLCRDMINWINSDNSTEAIQNCRAWYSVGPALLTRFLDLGKYRGFSVFPSYYFLPIHFTGLKYEGHKKVYAHQEWGTANQSYDTMNSVTLPAELCEPTIWISVLVSSYNTDHYHIRECLDSIKAQNGHFGIELVWLNDGSSAENTAILESELELFKDKTRFCKVIYEKTVDNRGTHDCLNRGIILCSNELIFKMDSDDIMLPDRIRIQMAFMEKTEDCVVCGSAIQLFKNDSVMDPRSKMMQMEKKHAFVLTWTDFLKTRPDWFLNHPTLCFRKSAVLAVGNYNKKRLYSSIMEDYDLELRLMKRYGRVYSLPDVLLYYRIHPGQLTYQNMANSVENLIIRKQLIEDAIAFI